MHRSNLSGSRAFLAALIAAVASVLVGGSDALATPDPGCGEPGRPPCPLQGWMRAQLGAQLARRDFETLALNLDRLAAHSPGEDYATWSDHARRGAEAARAKDAAGVRASCRGCHEEHRARYRQDKRQLPAPP